MTTRTSAGFGSGAVALGGAIWAVRFVAEMKDWVEMGLELVGGLLVIGGTLWALWKAGLLFPRKDPTVAADVKSTVANPPSEAPAPQAPPEEVESALVDPPLWTQVLVHGWNMIDAATAEIGDELRVEFHVFNAARAPMRIALGGHPVILYGDRLFEDTDFRLVPPAEQIPSGSSRVVNLVFKLRGSLGDDLHADAKIGRLLEIRFKSLEVEAHCGDRTTPLDLPSGLNLVRRESWFVGRVVRVHAVGSAHFGGQAT
jgi:hypothetical protein